MSLGFDGFALRISYCAEQDGRREKEHPNILEMKLTDLILAKIRLNVLRMCIT